MRDSPGIPRLFSVLNSSETLEMAIEDAGAVLKVVGEEEQ